MKKQALLNKIEPKLIAAGLTGPFKISSIHELSSITDGPDEGKIYDVSYYEKDEITGRINTVVDKNCELVDFGGIYKIKPEGGKTKLIYSEDFLYANEVVREENLVPDLLAENWISLVKEAHESPLKNITDSVYDYDDVQRETDTLLEHIRGITNQETGQIGIGNPAALSKYISKLKLGLEQAIPQKGEGLRRGDLINELVAIQESLYGPFDDAERA